MWEEERVKVGVPREVKNHEYRVAITPIGVHELTAHGHEVVVERDAGIGSQIPDYNEAFALAVLAMLPPLAIVVIFQSWFIKGLTESDK